MKQYRRVFAALDGGSTQQEVAERAIQIAKLNHAELMFGHVVDSVPDSLTGTDYKELAETVRKRLVDSLGDTLKAAEENHPQPDDQAVRARAGYLRRARPFEHHLRVRWQRFHVPDPQPALRRIGRKTGLIGCADLRSAQDSRNAMTLREPLTAQLRFQADWTCEARLASAFTSSALVRGLLAVASNEASFSSELARPSFGRSCFISSAILEKPQGNGIMAIRMHLLATSIPRERNPRG